MTRNNRMNVVSVALIGAAVIFFLYATMFMLKEFRNSVKCSERGGIYVQGYLSGKCFDKGQIISLEEK